MAFKKSFLELQEHKYFFTYGLQFKISEDNLNAQALRIVKTIVENLLR